MSHEKGMKIDDGGEGKIRGGTKFYHILNEVKMENYFQAIMSFQFLS